VSDTVPVDYPEWWREADDDRVAEIRAQYLRRTTRWDGEDARQVALALAYRQLGYSHSGVANRVGVDEATVAAYMAEVADAYGQSVRKRRSRLRSPSGPTDRSRRTPATTEVVGCECRRQRVSYHHRGNPLHFASVSRRPTFRHEGHAIGIRAQVA
jgi:hypothetical protein